jgi:hypothetical protein
MDIDFNTKTLNNIQKCLINIGKKFFDNKYKLIFIYHILTLLNTTSEISNYMIIDYDFSFICNNYYWLDNYQESNILDVILFLNKPIYKDLLEELGKILINKTYHNCPQKLLQFYPLFSTIQINFNIHDLYNDLNQCTSSNDHFNIFVNTFFTFSINKLFNNIYTLWISNKIKYINNQNENQKLYCQIQSLINTNQSNILSQYIPNLQNIDHNSYLDYSLKWSYNDYNNYYKLLEKYYNDLNSSIQIIHKSKKKYIPASMKDIVWNKRAINGCVRCEICNKILTPHTCHYSHYISEKNGGATTPNNLTILCQPCNLSMGSKNFQEFVNIYRHNITL